jgi:hypothetical protein|tara:strand:- start:738 stop:899 length:162 start_codon:yes stop_codon:yes gene_type:complete
MNSKTNAMKSDLKHALHVWKMNYLVDNGIMPDIVVSDFGGYLEVSFNEVSEEE